MEELGSELGRHCPASLRIYLQGDLGAGKTTLVRGFLRGRGHSGKVKSPTYTLVEPYELASDTVFHFDLYRIEEDEELLNIGFQDYLQDEAIILLEWPEKAAAILEPPDILVNITILPQGRSLEFSANSLAGEKIVSLLQ